MIYQIKRGKQDVNLINDKNPKQRYKFVLFVGENGSGKTNFLDLIDKILKNDILLILKKLIRFLLIVLIWT